MNSQNSVAGRTDAPQKVEPPMKKLILTVVLALAVIGVTRAVASDSVTMKGYLIDVSCATKHAGEDNFAQDHDKDCLLMCAKSGFGVLTGEGKFVKFTEEGNKKVEAFLKETDATGSWKVEVTGKLMGELLSVDSIALQAQ
jgi:hypothetical protein